MTFNLEKLQELAQPRDEVAVERARYRKENREWIRLSQEIAIELHKYLRNEHITQKKLAEMLGVSAVYVNKILKGGENLTLETVCKIQSAIGRQIITISKND
jgi:predicted XRE-type DNA-binding protein